jgi:hypothetical protein
MYFVQSGSEQDEAEGPHARLQRIRLFLFQTAVSKERQQEVLHDVTEFANNKMPNVEVLKREPREEKCQNWKNDLRRVRGRKLIRREEEYRE